MKDHSTTKYFLWYSFPNIKASYFRIILYFKKRFFPPSKAETENPRLVVRHSLTVLNRCKYKFQIVFSNICTGVVQHRYFGWNETLRLNDFSTRIVVAKTI